MRLINITYDYLLNETASSAFTNSIDLIFEKRALNYKFIKIFNSKLSIIINHFAV